jgi:hypothetical protein
VRAILSLESLFWVFSTCIFFEYEPSCPSNRSFGSSELAYYLSAGYLVPQITLSGLQPLYIILVRAILSLESLFRVFSSCILFECGLSCPLNRSFRSSAPVYYSSAGYLAPQNALSGLQHLYIIRVRAILSLESLFWVFSTYILFECGLSCPSNRSLGLQHHLTFECGLLVP